MGKEIKTISDNLTALDHYYEKQDIATRECLLALKSIILSIDENIFHFRKFQIPFFRYKEFSIGFLWVYRKRIIVGFVEDKMLSLPTIIGRKKDRVITMEVHPLKDIPFDIIQYNFREIITKYSRQLSNDNKTP